MKSLFFFLISFTLIGSITGQTDSPQQQHPPDNGSIVLTSRNFDSSISDGSVWLVEFYADWCGHCKRFAPTYESVANRLHATHEKHDRKVMVGKINGGEERALSSRFSVKGFPSFYLLDGYDVYEFKGHRSLDSISKFALKGYEAAEPIPFLNSPFGPMGQLRAFTMSFGTKVLDMYSYLVSTKNFKPVFATALLMGLFITVGVFVIIAVGLLTLPKEKIE